MDASDTYGNFIIDELIQVLQIGKLYQMTGLFSDMGQEDTFVLVKEANLLDKQKRRSESTITVQGQPWVMYFGPSDLEFTDWVRILYHNSIYLTSALNFEHHLIENKILTKEYLRRHCVSLEN